MAYPLNLREEELKNKVAHDYFPQYDSTKIIGDIDFCIAHADEKSKQADSPDELSRTQSFLWAESKKGNKNSLYESLVQLILTIGKARTFDKYLPPIFLGAFDAEKIAFIEYDKISWIFYKNDFNWNVTPSNHETKSFREVLSLVESLLEDESLLFTFSAEDEESLKKFIRENFKIGRGVQKIAITKNNFTTVYLRWLRDVKSSIDVDWDLLKKNHILDADFFLADLLSENNESLKDSLFVLLKSDHYIFGRHKNDLGLETIIKAAFRDGQKAHARFWNIYVRPPRQEFWDYIVERRDLLVPQDIRERKGSFFTPQQWVELSQQALAEALGEDWQDEYIVWDCCAGTGNLLHGLTNKYNILPHPRGTVITDKNILEICVYYAVRKCIKATWVNDRDQFYEPNDNWMTDRPFQADCVAFTLFDNNISHAEGTNHWIPFSEQEVDARERFHSHFMTDFLHGSAKSLPLFAGKNDGNLSFSAEAQAVFDAGRDLYRYYHARPDADPNASFYDIRLSFQGKDAKGRMNSKSPDARYTELLALLRQAQKRLAKKIEPKVYEYGFLL